MGDHQNLGFGKFVPGFDFLQNLAKGAAQTLPQMPNLSSWVAPTFDVEELEKRISELKAVHFWLDQNSNALRATIQALEVQKMTLATLKGMNFNMGDVANAMKLNADAMLSGMQKMGEQAVEAAGGGASASSPATAKSPPRKTSARTAAATSAANSGNSASASIIDPMQWWGALTDQFQQIAASAMKDVNPAMAAATNMASGMAKEAFKTAETMSKATSAGHGRARKTAPRPAAAKKTRR